MPVFIIWWTKNCQRGYLAWLNRAIPVIEVWSAHLDQGPERIIRYFRICVALKWCVWKNTPRAAALDSLRTQTGHGTRLARAKGIEKPPFTDRYCEITFWRLFRQEWIGRSVRRPVLGKGVEGGITFSNEFSRGSFRGRPEGKASAMCAHTSWLRKTGRGYERGKLWGHWRRRETIGTWSYSSPMQWVWRVMAPKAAYAIKITLEFDFKTESSFKTRVSERPRFRNRRSPPGRRSTPSRTGDFAGTSHGKYPSFDRHN